ncbi:hypothetical protein Tco_0795369 [Tanacetum coccineum]
MTDSQSPVEGVRRVLPEFRVIGPQPWVKEEAYPSPLPEQIFASATQQMSQIRKRSSIKQNFNANHEGCQLVDSPIIIEALIEGAETRAKLKESRTPLVGFSSKVSYPIGTINLNVTMGEPERLRTIPMEFAVVKSHSPYNVILGRTGLRSLAAVASTIHSMIKFPTANGIETMITKRNSPQMPKDGSSNNDNQERNSPPPPNTSTEFWRNDQPGQKRRSIENGQSRRAR